MSLHGATSNHLLNRRRVFGLGNRPGESDYEAIRNDVTYPDVDFIVATPYGRGEVAGYAGIAEGDVLRVMDDVARAYNVDPDRVHLTGLSMGGGGTWQIGLRYPDRFASITPVCAVADLAMFPWAAAMPSLDKELAELTSAMAVAENAVQPAGLHLPRRRGPRGARRAVAQDGRDLQGPGLARQERPLLRASRASTTSPGTSATATPPSSIGSGRSAVSPSPSTSSTRPTPSATTRPTGCASTASTTG